jgi:hypothetical protein
LSGAKTVIPLAEFSVSTRPAFSTAWTSVDSTGLLDAAVATGAADMPVKLPAPDLGTAAQPGPKSDMAAEEADEDMDDDGDAAGDADELEDEEEPHAAAPMLRLTASPDNARIRRLFIVSPSAGFPVWPG